MLAARAGHGRVCDGHGDLLASDVFLLDDGPRVLDCIEFDPRLRHVDVIADVAFLAMDLERLGASAAAATFLRLYEESAGDVFPPTLLHHYCAERAVVRAEVGCIRAAQAGGDGAGGGGGAGAVRDLLDLALGHLEEGRVVLAVVSGQPGTGKSSVAAAVGDRLRWPVLRSDEVRVELTGGAGRAPRAPFATAAYTPEMHARTYGTLLERAAVALGLGQPVVLDATFSDPRWRRAVEDMARATVSDLVVMECRADLDTTVPRLRARAMLGEDVSGADETVALAMAGGARPWSGAVPLDTTGASPTRAVEEALAVLRPPDRTARRRGVPEPAGRPGGA